MQLEPSWLGRETTSTLGKHFPCLLKGPWKKCYRTCLSKGSQPDHQKPVVLANARYAEKMTFSEAPGRKINTSDGSLPTQI